MIKTISLSGKFFTIIIAGILFGIWQHAVIAGVFMIFALLSSAGKLIEIERRDR